MRLPHLLDLRGIGPDQTRANLDAMLAELKRRGIPVLMTGMIAAPAPM